MAGTPRRQVSPGDIIHMYNTSVTAIAACRQVMADSGVFMGVKYPTATTDPLVGVTVAAIASKDWGDVQIRGVALVAAHGAFATGMTRVMSTAATGRATAFAAAGGVNAQNGGLALNTALAQDDLLEVLLAGPCIVEQGA